MSIAPYVEAPYNRTITADSSMSGSDLSIVEPQLQGVEIRTERQRYAGTLPKIWTGRSDNQIIQDSFGEGDEFRQDTPFQEMARFDPAVYLNNRNVLMFPVVLDDPSFLDPENFDGVIEPLTIAGRASLVAVDFPFFAHAIKGHIQGGNEDSFQKSDSISAIYPLALPIRTEYWIDSVALIGSAVSGTIEIPGVFPDVERILSPFDDTIALDRIRQVDSNWSGDMRVAIIQMTGSSSDNYIPFGSKSASTGFAFYGGQLGTDSIAFGGLKR